MPDGLIVDTDICIDISRAHAPSIARLDRAEQLYRVAMSDVTHMELLVGCVDKRQQRETEKFLRRFERIPVDAAISARAIELLRRYRLSHGLLLADALIAATALTHSLPLLTKNARDFRFISALVLEPYA
jgi:hypothetical protein